MDVARLREELARFPAKTPVVTVADEEGTGFCNALRVEARDDAILIWPTAVASASPGTVALAGARVWRTYPSRQVSDHEGQFGERVGETSCRSDTGSEVEEASAKVLDEGVPADDHSQSGHASALASGEGGP
jgi:hypothetical protein